MKFEGGTGLPYDFWDSRDGWRDWTTVQTNFIKVLSMWIERRSVGAFVFFGNAILFGNGKSMLNNRIKNEQRVVELIRISGPGLACENYDHGSS